MKKVLVIILFSMFFLDCASHNRKTLLGRITDLEEKVEKLERNTVVITDEMPYMPMIEWEGWTPNDVQPERTDIIEIPFDINDLNELLEATDVTDLSYLSEEDELRKLIKEVLEEIKGERKK